MVVSYSKNIATVKLNRGSHHNRINENMAFELQDAFGHLGQNPSVRVVILSGVGEYFCKGTDFPPISSQLSNVSYESTLEMLRVSDVVASIRQPVIAVINGDAIDQGMELTLACDIRIASTSAMFGLTQMSKGYIPWDGGSQRLPRLIGQGRAMEMILNSRIIGVDEALHMGLITSEVPPEKLENIGLLMASTIASHGPTATQYLKEAVLKGSDLTLRQGLRLEADLSFLLQTTSDRSEGIKSFLERRKPEYKGE